MYAKQILMERVWVPYLPRAMGMSVRLGEDLLINGTAIIVSMASASSTYRAICQPHTLEGTNQS